MNSNENIKINNQKKGDPIWLSTVFDILSILGSIASIGSISIELRRFYSKREQQKGNKQINEHIENIHVQFLKYKDTTRRLFYLLNENIEDLRNITVNSKQLFMMIDKYHYQVYLDIKKEFNNIKSHISEIQNELESLAIDLKIEKPDNDIGNELIEQIDQILNSWGKMKWTDFLNYLSDFNNIVNRFLHDSENIEQE